MEPGDLETHLLLASTALLPSFILFAPNTKYRSVDLASCWDAIEALRCWEDLTNGYVTTTSTIQEWIISADLAFNGKVFKNDVLVELDSGTGTIVA